MTARSGANLGRIVCVAVRLCSLKRTALRTHPSTAHTRDPWGVSRSEVVWTPTITKPRPCPKHRGLRCYSPHRTTSEREDWAVSAIPTCKPDEWDDNTIVLSDEFCSLIPTSASTVHDWKTRGFGPRWCLFIGTGRWCTTVANVRRLERRGC